MFAIFGCLVLVSTSKVRPLLCWTFNMVMGRFEIASGREMIDVYLLNGNGMESGHFFDLWSAFGSFRQTLRIREHIALIRRAPGSLVIQCVACSLCVRVAPVSTFQDGTLLCLPLGMVKVRTFGETSSIYFQRKNEHYSEKRTGCGKRTFFVF